MTPWEPPPTVWCAPTDAQYRVWVLRFDDPGRDDKVFSGHGAETAARRAWAEASQAWNCHLLATVPRATD